MPDSRQAINGQGNSVIVCHINNVIISGDARTNWELNRHFQFALLAKNFYATSDLKYYRELQALFDSWRRENPFLKGISWTSVMEVAIRAINWMYTLAFLSQSKNVDKDFKIRLSVGIRNMIGYVSQHYSRFFIGQQTICWWKRQLSGLQDWLSIVRNGKHWEFPSLRKNY